MVTMYRFSSPGILDLKQIYQHARDCYPNECCGFALKRGTKTCRNIINELHKLDPATYSRTATEGFAFSAEDTLYLSKNISSANPIVAIYHSHPDVGAYFSQEDKDNALFENELIWPVDYLVVDINEWTVVGSKLFRFLDGDFHEIAIFEGLDI